MCPRQGTACRRKRFLVDRRGRDAGDPARLRIVDGGDDRVVRGRPAAADTVRGRTPQVALERPVENRLADIQDARDPRPLSRDLRPDAGRIANRDPSGRGAPSAGVIRGSIATSPPQLPQPPLPQEPQPPPGPVGIAAAAASALVAAAAVLDALAFGSS